MPLLSVEEFKLGFETDLDDDVLQQHLDSVEAELELKFGASDEDGIEDFSGGSTYLFPVRPVLTVTSIVETVGITDTTLSSDDWKLWHGGRQIERLGNGTNGRLTWGERVRITFAGTDQLAIRRQVQNDLVKADIQFQGLTSVKSGNWAGSNPDYAKLRTSILSRLTGVQFV